MPRDTARSLPVAAALLLAAACLAAAGCQAGPRLHCTAPLARLPLKTIQEKLIVPGTLMGRHEVAFVVDTHSGLSIISRESARNLNLFRKERLGTVVVYGIEEPEAMLLAGGMEAALGAIEVTGWTVGIRDLPHALREAVQRPVGILGLDFLSQFVCILDPRCEEMLLLHEGTWPPQQQREEWLRNGLFLDAVYEPGSGIGVDVCQDGVAYRVWLDTGADSSAISSALVEQLGWDTQSMIRRVEHRWGIEGIRHHEVIKGYLVLAGYRIEPLRAAIVRSSKPFVNLGMEALSHFRMAFDFRAEKVCLLPYEPPPDEASDDPGQ